MRDRAVCVCGCVCACVCVSEGERHRECLCVRVCACPYWDVWMGVRPGAEREGVKKIKGDVLFSALPSICFLSVTRQHLQACTK